MEDYARRAMTGWTERAIAHIGVHLYREGGNWNRSEMTADGKVRVLLADDEEDVRHLLRLNLEIDGRFLVVGEAKNGAEAVALTRILHPDAVVLDILMPVMGGVDALPLIMDAVPETCVVVLSAYPESMVADMRALGAYAYHQKEEPPQVVADSLWAACTNPN
jgi:DNA-binding NarL/FixJ family response regulator